MDELHRPNKITREERYYTDEVLVFFNNFKLLMDLWRALISTLETEFKEAPAKDPQSQLTKGWAITEANFSSSQQTLQ